MLLEQQQNEQKCMRSHQALLPSAGFNHLATTKVMPREVKKKQKTKIIMCFPSFASN